METVADLTDTTSLDRSSSGITVLNSITGVLTDNTDKSYTYQGNANGAYMADGKASYFKVYVSLTAEF